MNMELIDVTNWKNDIFENYGGYTRKIGKVSSDGDRYMVKFEKKHSFECAPLNLFEQHINSEILRLCGFNSQETFLGICDDYLVLCCKNFVPTDSKLITFDVFLRQIYNSYELTEIIDLNKFERVLQENETLRPYGKIITESFWDMVVLDVFMMNLERTTSDFGCIISKDKVTPAPFFDNRSNGLARTIPLRKNGKAILRDDILHSHKFKDFDTARQRIVPILECKIDAIHNLVYEQKCLSEAQKSLKIEQLQKSLHDLKCSYNLSQVYSTMEIENLPLTEQSIKNLQKIAHGHKTVDEIIEEIKYRYS